MSPVEVVVITPDHLRELIREELANMRQRRVEAEARLSPTEVARLLRVRTKVVYDALRAGSLRGERRADRWFIRREDADTWVRSTGREVPV